MALALTIHQDRIVDSPPRSYYSVALNLVGRRCLVVGGGPVAARKLDALAEAEAATVVVAPTVSARMAAAASRHGVEIVQRAFVESDLDGAFLVIAATSDRAVNQRVAEAARLRGILVNSADDPANCDFVLPAVVRRGNVHVAVTTGGRSPALARHLRERLEAEIPIGYAALAEVVARVRAAVRSEGVAIDPASWQEAIQEDVLTLAEQGRVAEAASLLRSRLRSAKAGADARDASPRAGEVGTDAATTRDPSPRTLRTGRIVLVGAGPGDPGLLTVAGLQAIAEADAIVYDRLANPALLEHARPDATLVYAGKEPRGGLMGQEEINRILCDRAAAGQVVVRLKGGDPFVFGRGGEEVLAAVAAGIPFSVIPGVSAAIAAPAYAGIPVTHRGAAAAFTVITGHEDPGKTSDPVDWEAVARIGGTIVLLMGTATLAAICERLIGAGVAPETPAAVVGSGTTDTQTVVTGTVADIARRARAAKVRAPTTTVIGEVAALAASLAWFQPAAEADLPAEAT
jgi:uroporphyrin-III C-methyltransferase/precorrin-2 dehydrogenase/sirohydrochlorin ferrochelatase